MKSQLFYFSENCNVTSNDLINPSLKILLLIVNNQQKLQQQHNNNNNINNNNYNNINKKTKNKKNEYHPQQYNNDDKRIHQDRIGGLRASFLVSDLRVDVARQLLGHSGLFVGPAEPAQLYQFLRGQFSGVGLDGWLLIASLLDSVSCK